MCCLRVPEGGSTGQAETKVLCVTKSLQKPCANSIALAEPRVGADLLTPPLLFSVRGERQGSMASYQPRVGSTVLIVSL